MHMRWSFLIICVKCMCFFLVQQGGCLMSQCWVALYLACSPHHVTKGGKCPIKQHQLNIILQALPHKRDQSFVAQLALGPVDLSSALNLVSCCTTVTLVSRTSSLSSSWHQEGSTCHQTQPEFLPSYITLLLTRKGRAHDRIPWKPGFIPKGRRDDLNMLYSQKLQYLVRSIGKPPLHAVSLQMAPSILHEVLILP